MTAVEQESGELTGEILALQEIVDARLRRLPAPFAELGTDDQAKFLDDAERSVRFELEHGEMAFMALALVVQGDSGFIVEEIDGKSGFNVQHMTEGESLHGFIDDAAHVRIVPPLANVLTGSATPMHEAQVTVLLHLVEAVFKTSAGERQLDKKYLTYVPLVYPGFRYDQESEVKL